VKIGDMSQKKPVEFRTPPKHLGGDAISVSVTFNYPGGKYWKGGLTIHADNKAELKAELKKVYYEKRPKPQVKQLVEDLKDTTELDFDEEP